MIKPKLRGRAFQCFGNAVRQTMTVSDDMQSNPSLGSVRNRDEEHVP